MMSASAVRAASNSPSASAEPPPSLSHTSIPCLTEQSRGLSTVAKSPNSFAFCEAAWANTYDCPSSGRTSSLKLSSGLDQKIDISQIRRQAKLRPRIMTLGAPSMSLADSHGRRRGGRRIFRLDLSNNLFGLRTLTVGAAINT
jgi:hypothetical protein